MEMDAMNARKTAAQFAARVWYSEVRAANTPVEEAARFAQQNWSAFLPIVPEGLGRLLHRIASRGQQVRRRSRLRRPSLAKVG